MHNHSVSYFRTMTRGAQSSRPWTGTFFTWGGPPASFASAALAMLSAFDGVLDPRRFISTRDLPDHDYSAIQESLQS